MNEQSERLAKFAPRLDRLREDPQARVHYELMSDSLVWSDELPPPDEYEASDCWGLRGIWRFRTTLILGNPDERLRTHWDEAQRLFPNWPGFLPQRQSATLREFFEQRRAKFGNSWEELDDRYRRRLAEKSKEPVTG